MDLQQDLKWLSTHPQFASFISSVKDDREACINAMHEASPAKIMQISGRILAYDELLRTVNAEELIRRHTQ